MKTRLLKEALMQQYRALLRCVGGINPLANAPLSERQLARRRQLPVVVGQPLQGRTIAGKHLLHHLRREQVLQIIPAQQQTVFEVNHLMIQPHLRRLRQRKIGPGRGFCQRIGHAEHAGEHHRHRARFPAMMLRQLPHHADSGDLLMIQIAPDLRLHPLGMTEPALIRPGVILRQYQRGKVADDPVDVRMERLAVKQRHINHQRALPAPAAQRLGEAGQQQHRGGDLRLARPLQDLLPLRRCQPGLQAVE